MLQITGAAGSRLGAKRSLGDPGLTKAPPPRTDTGLGAGTGGILTQMSPSIFRISVIFLLPVVMSV